MSEPAALTVKPAPPLRESALLPAVQRAANGRGRPQDWALIHRADGQKLTPLLRKAVDAVLALEALDARMARDKFEAIEREKREAEARHRKLVDAARNREDMLLASVKSLHARFSSPDPAEHRLGVIEMAGRDPRWLPELQIAFRKQYGYDLYTWLLHTKRDSNGVVDALALLRISADGGNALDGGSRAAQENLSDEAFKRLVIIIVRSFNKWYRDEQEIGYKALLGQPKAVLEPLSKAFERWQRKPLIDYLIDDVRRSDYSVRAISIVRDGTADAGKDYVDLAADLIPDSGDDARMRSVDTLTAIKSVSRRQRVEQAYNKTFKGVGHRAGRHAPDTLRGHLEALEGVLDVGTYHHTLALLNHEPTPAEQLYFLLPRWRHAHVADAIELLKKFVQDDVSIEQLEADWAQYVQTAQPGNSSPFTTLPLLPHIRSVLALKDSSELVRARNYLGRLEFMLTDSIAQLALHDVLPGNSSEDKMLLGLLRSLSRKRADPESVRLAQKGAEPKPDAASGDDKELDDDAFQRYVFRLAAEERDERRKEDVRLAVARRVLNADRDSVLPSSLRSGRTGSALTPLHDAIKDIAAVLDRRVERQQRRLASWRVKGTRLSEAQRNLLIVAGEKLLARDQADADARRKSLNADITANAFLLSNSELPLARLELVPNPTAADEVYGLALSREFDRMTDRVTRVWATTGGMDRFMADSARATLDRDGNVLRPAYQLWTLFDDIGNATIGKSDLNFLQKPVNAVASAIARAPLLGGGSRPWRRAMALCIDGLDDYERGAVRLRTDLLHGSELLGSRASSDLVDVIKFLKTDGLKAKRRDKVVARFVDVYLEPADARRPDETPIAAFLRYIETHFEGRTENYLTLRDLLAPPQTREDTARYARDRAEAHHRGSGSSDIVRGFAEWTEKKLGTHRRESADRSAQWLEYIAQCGPNELARMQNESGRSGQNELTAHYYEQYKHRLTEVKALEEAVVDKLADLVELAIESGAGLLTGGAGWLVLAAFAAANANIAVHEALLGPEYKAASIANFSAVIQTAFGALANEGGLREKFTLKVVTLKWLGKRWGIVGKGLQESLQNMFTGAIEGSVATGTELGLNAMFGSRWLNDDDIGKQTHLMLGKIAAKPFSTVFGTQHWNPGNVHDYSTAANVLKQSVLFKMALKSENIAKEIVKLYYSEHPGQPFADTFMNITLKIVWGEAKSVVKGLASAIGKLPTNDGRRAFVTKFREEHPEQFAAALAEAIQGRYSHEDSAALRERIAARIKAKPALTVLDAVLEEMRHDDVLKSKVQKSVLAAAEAAFTRKPREGLLADTKNARSIDELGVDPEIQRRLVELGRRQDLPAEAATPAAVPPAAKGPAAQVVSLAELEQRHSQATPHPDPSDDHAEQPALLSRPAVAAAPPHPDDALTKTAPPGKPASEATGHPAVPVAPPQPSTPLHEAARAPNARAAVQPPYAIEARTALHLLLTKRNERIRDYSQLPAFTLGGRYGFLPNKVMAEVIQWGDPKDPQFIDKVDRRRAALTLADLTQPGREVGLLEARAWRDTYAQHTLNNARRSDGDDGMRGNPAAPHRLKLMQRAVELLEEQERLNGRSARDLELEKNLVAGVAQRLEDGDFTSAQVAAALAARPRSSVSPKEDTGPPALAQLAAEAREPHPPGLMRIAGHHDAASLAVLAAGAVRRPPLPVTTLPPLPTQAGPLPARGTPGLPKAFASVGEFGRALGGLFGSHPHIETISQETWTLLRDDIRLAYQWRDYLVKRAGTPNKGSSAYQQALAMTMIVALLDPAGEKAEPR